MAPTDLDLSEFDAYIKKTYDDGIPADLAFRRMPLMEHMEKKGGFTGESLTFPVRTDYPAGVSSSLANAQTNARPSKRYKFTLTRAHHYASVPISAETIYASMGNEAAFAEGLEDEIDAMLKALGKKAAIQLYGAGDGSIGRISAYTGGTKVITLTEQRDALKFGEGQTIQVFAAKTGGSARAGTIEVDFVDPDTGQVTFIEVVDTAITSPAVNDYLKVMGDHDDVMVGLEGWIPADAPTSTPFFGLDRTKSPHRLAGRRLDGRGMPIYEALTRLAETLIDGGADTDSMRAYISTQNWTEMGIELGDKKVSDQDEFDMGYTSVRINLSSGDSLRVYGDPYAPEDLGYVLPLKDWKLHHMKEFPHVVRDDGKGSNRQASADGIEVRGRFWGNPKCKAPGHSGVTKL